MTPDVLIVGSGPGGVNAAAPLVEAGWSVTLLDYGNRDDRYAPLIPPLPFVQLRRADGQQHRYFLGDDFEGLPDPKVRVGAQLTPPRQYVQADVGRLMPVVADNFSVMESLARGGLGNAWGAGVFPFSDGELARTGLTAADLAPHYEAVAERIGVAGARDDLLPFLGDCRAMQPPLEIDANAERILARYAARRKHFQANGFYLGQTRLAVCTRPHRGRGPHGYQDMDFWADFDRSVYRPRWALEELAHQPNFRYIDRSFVLSFREPRAGVVEVIARDADHGQCQTYCGRALVLAAGTLSTARIVLRSLNRYAVRLPVLCNPYTYVPVVNLYSLGRPARDARYSLAQLTAVYRPPDGSGELVQTQFYSYRSLLAFKLLKEVPLGYRNALRVLRVLMNAIGILGISHADSPTPAKHCLLERGEDGQPDRLRIEYALSAPEQRQIAQREKAVLGCFRRLGCWGLKSIRPGHGTSIHYAGTLPISSQERDLTCDADCRLRGTHAVYLADGSVFGYLPAKGLTLSLMANADRVGQRVARQLALSRGKAA
jgi:choline dehydrogenase-like flavoprotein